MYKLYGDFETASEKDIKKVGGYVYTLDPSTFPLCFGFSVGAHEFLIDFSGSVKDVLARKVLAKHVMDPNCLFVFHNANFDRTVWNKFMVEKLGLPALEITRVRCTMAKAYAYGLPGTLEEAANALSLIERKDTHGSAVMKTLCKPRRKTKNNSEKWWTPESAPQAFETLYKYCLQDIRTTIQLDLRLPDLSNREELVWQIDQRINQEGVRLDLEAIAKCIKLREQNKKDLLNEFEEITGGYVKSPTQRATFIKWLNARGVEVADSKATTLRKVKFAPTDVERAIDIGRELGKTSLAKLDTMLSRSVNGILREILQYHGTHTGRWAGRGVQLQNLKRSHLPMDKLVDDILKFDYDWFSFNYGDVNDALSSAIRGMLIPRKGRRFIIADFAQMEARVLAWLGNSLWKINIFNLGEDVYLRAASAIYGREITKDDKSERQVGKVAELALGYGGGIAAFAKMAIGYDLDLRPIANMLWISASQAERDSAMRSYQMYLKRFAENQRKGMQKGEEPVTKEVAYAADIIKQRWRQANPEITNYWKDTESAAIRAVRRRVPQVCGKVIWYTSEGFLHCRLPSGRVQTYNEPRVGEDGKLSYMGKCPITARWIRIWTHGGKLVENITQAVQRDLLSEALVRLEKVYPVLFHVHDELISEVPFDSDEEDLKEYERIMCKARKWATGMPIDVTIEFAKRYKK